MELCDSANPLGTRSKESGSEMQCSLLLTESTTSDDADTSGVKKSQTVVFIRLSTLLLGLFNGLLREGDCGEEVHGAGGGLAVHAFHFAEGFVEGGGALLEAGEDAAFFGVVGFVGWVAFDGGFDHEGDEALTDDWRAELDADVLVDLLGDLDWDVSCCIRLVSKWSATHLLVKADKLKVTTTVTTLSNHTLADTVQTDKLKCVELAILILLALL